MQLNLRTALGAFGLVVLAIATYLVTTHFFIEESGSPPNARRTPSSTGVHTAHIRTVTVPGNQPIPPPPRQPLKLSPRGILGSSHGHCSRFDVADNVIEFKAEVEYQTIKPNITCSWEIQVFRADDPKKPVFTKPLPDKTVKIVVDKPYTWTFEENIPVPSNLSPGKYRLEFVRHENSPKTKQRSALCTSAFVIK